MCSEKEHREVIMCTCNCWTRYGIGIKWFPQLDIYDVTWRICAMDVLVKSAGGDVCL